MSGVIVRIVPLPISKNQVRRLGSRLRDAPVPDEEDLDLVQRVLEAYDAALRSTSERLWHDLGITSSGRLKHLGTIVEKLRRESGTNLAGIQDIAGRRIVLDRSARRSDQDDVRDLVVAAFGGEHAPRVHDRRVTPSRGYRAVHVVVTVGDLPVEIQIRTHWQQRWAELFEKMGDRFGRGIRYDGGAPDLGVLLAGHPDDERQRTLGMIEAVVGTGLALAEIVNGLEGFDDRCDEPATSRMWVGIDELMSAMSDMIDAVRTSSRVGS